MKVKHIITTACGVILGGLAVAQGASAVVTYAGESEVQFTFAPTLSVGVSGDFTIADLTPGSAANSNTVVVTVTTNSSSGYTLSATVGNTSSYNTTNLVGDNGGVFSMISPSATSLSSGTWGYTLNGTVYDELSTTVPKVIKQTSSSSESSTTNMQIGASAALGQLAGSYRNIINFAATSNVNAYTVTVVAGSNVASVTPATAASHDAGDTVSITATCASGYTFAGWSADKTYGTIANPTVASTTYTVGGGDVTLTATCSN